jgi:hypothetical protein
MVRTVREIADCGGQGAGQAFKGGFRVFGNFGLMWPFTP